MKDCLQWCMCSTLMKSFKGCIPFIAVWRLTNHVINWMNGKPTVFIYWCTEINCNAYIHNFSIPSRIIHNFILHLELCDYRKHDESLTSKCGYILEEPMGMFHANHMHIAFFILFNLYVIVVNIKYLKHICPYFLFFYTKYNFLWGHHVYAFENI